MAHTGETKARALALLTLGNTPRYVARETGVPLTTMRRWRPEAMALWSDIPGIADLRRDFAEIAQQIGAVFPGLLQQNGPKKEKE
jgi:hypothetical protein